MYDWNFQFSKKFYIFFRGWNVNFVNNNKFWWNVNVKRLFSRSIRFVSKCWTEFQLRKTCFRGEQTQFEWIELLYWESWFVDRPIGRATIAIIRNYTRDCSVNASFEPCQGADARETEWREKVRGPGRLSKGRIRDICPFWSGAKLKPACRPAIFRRRVLRYCSADITFVSSVLRD